MIANRQLLQTSAAPRMEAGSAGHVALSTNTKQGAARPPHCSANGLEISRFWRTVEILDQHFHFWKLSAASCGPTDQVSMRRSTLCKTKSDSPGPPRQFPSIKRFMRDGGK